MIQEYRNDLNPLLISIGIISLTILFAMILYYGTVSAIIFGLALASISFYVTIYNAIASTPKKIMIISNELILYTFFGKEMSYKLESINFLVIHPPDPPQWRKKYLVGGYAKPNNGRMFVFTREIGYAIREAYREEVGHYPPEKPGVVSGN